MDYLSRGAKRRLKKYLKKVGRAMRKKGAGRDEIESVKESLREQVQEIIGEPEQKLGKTEIEDILVNFDPPKVFAEQVDEVGLSPPEAPKLARFSVAASIGGILVMLFINLIAKASGGDGEEIGGGFFVMIEVLALLAGILTFKTKVGKIGTFLSGAILLLVFMMIAAEKGGG